MTNSSRGTALPGPLVSGPDGALWFAYDFVGVRRITTAGAVTTNPVPPPSTGPVNSLTVGPDGDIWFATLGGAQSSAYIGQMTLSSTVLNEYQPPSEPGGGATVLDHATGPDGNLWFTDQFEDVVGTMTTSGQAFDYPNAPNSASIAPGIDGNVWFAGLPGDVSRITTGASGAVVAPPSITTNGTFGAVQTCNGAQWGSWMGQSPVPGSSVLWDLAGHNVLGGPTYTPSVSARPKTLTCTGSASYPALNVTVPATSAPVTVRAPPSLSSATAARDAAAQLNLTPAWGTAFQHRSPLTNLVLGTAGMSCPASVLALGPGGGAFNPECLTEFRAGRYWYVVGATVSRRQDVQYYVDAAAGIPPSGTASLVRKVRWVRAWKRSRIRRQLTPARRPYPACSTPTTTTGPQMTGHAGTTS